MSWLLLQAPEPRPAMTAGLLLVLVVAKLVVLVGRGIPLAGWATLGLSLAGRRDGVGLRTGRSASSPALPSGAAASASCAPPRARTLYVLLVAYVAINVPVMLVLATPLTPAMLRGARGALADSIGYYATAANLGSIALVLAIGLLTTSAGLRNVVARLADRRVVRPGEAGRGAIRSSHPTRVDRLALALIAAGVWASTRVETLGLDRNAVTALIPNTLPAVAAATSGDDWTGARATTDAAGGPDLRVFCAARLAGSTSSPSSSSPRRPGTSVRTARRSIRRRISRPCPSMPCCSRTPTRCIRRASRASSRRCAHGTRRLACRRSSMPPRPALPDLSCFVPPATTRRCSTPAGSAIWACRRSSPTRASTCSKTPAPSAATSSRASAWTSPRRWFGSCGWIDSLPRGERFMAAYLPVAGHHPYVDADARALPVDDGGLAVSECAARRRRGAGQAARGAARPRPGSTTRS